MTNLANVEQNGIFLHVLTTLVFEATPLSARVRIDRPRDHTPPRTHMFVRVELDGASWLTDVGVGALSLTAPLRLTEGLAVQETPHEPRLFRVGVNCGDGFEPVPVVEEIDRRPVRKLGNDDPQQPVKSGLQIE